MLIPLYVFTPDLSNYHEVLFQTYQTEEYYNGIGKFTLVVSPTAENILHLKKDCILYRTDIKQAMWIRRVSPDTSQRRITVNGYTTNALLNKRVLESPLTIGNVESGVYNAISENLRGLPNIEIAENKGLSQIWAGIVEKKELLTSIIPILDTVDLGHKMTFDYKAKKHKFEIYQGRDLTYGYKAVIFSDERGTARDLKIENDDSVFKNVCYVIGETTDGNGNKTQTVYQVGNATGDNRYEMWASAVVQKQENETNEAFRARINDVGLTELAKRISRTSFSVSVDESEYGKSFQLGDKVSCVSKRFGVKFSARVTGVKFTQDPNKKSTNIILGTPELDIIGEMRL